MLLWLRPDTQRPDGLKGLSEVAQTVGLTRMQVGDCCQGHMLRSSMRALQGLLDM